MFSYVYLESTTCESMPHVSLSRSLHVVFETLCNYKIKFMDKCITVVYPSCSDARELACQMDCLWYYVQLHFEISCFSLNLNALDLFGMPSVFLVHCFYFPFLYAIIF